MMAALRTKSGPNTAWKAGWVSPTVWDGNAPRRRTSAAAPAMPRPSASGGHHPLADPSVDAHLIEREREIEGGFASLLEVLQRLAPQQFSDGFPAMAVNELAAIGVRAETAWFEAAWNRPLEMGTIYAHCASRLFSRMVQTGSDAVHHASDGEPASDLIRRWGFHAVNITPCADARLSGLLGAVLRVPLSVVTARRSYAGAMFPVASALRDWESVELSRYRTATPNAADEDTRYLKIGVYHFSSLDPLHHGCSGHGSNDAKAISALMQRLEEFQGAVQSRHGAGDKVATLLIGLNTDTDAIRVHVPDASGAMTAERYVDAAKLHGETKDMTREAAKEYVRQAVAAVIGVHPDDEPTQGMRWFCAYLLKNNLAQVEAVLHRYGGPYPEMRNAAKLIVIGDPVDDAQLRNLAFQAQMDSVEEGGADLDVGVKILGGLMWEQGLAAPVLVHKSFSPELPGDEAVARQAAIRMANAVETRFAGKRITVETAIRPSTGGEMIFLDRATSVGSAP